MDCKKLREWFKENAAALPWRPTDLDAPRDPYAVWISETMLQQTQVSTVRDYFVKWMKRFPDIATLAKASEEEVFKYWQGLGYYSRARNILKTAKLIAESGTPKKGIPKFPQTRKALEALPGIGAYTAGAILSLAYHQREAILDGNLVRIFSRLYALDFLPTDKGSAGKNPSEIYWNYAREMADSPPRRTAPQNSRPPKSTCKKTGTAPSSSSKAWTTRFSQSTAGRNSSRTSSRSRTLNHRGTRQRASPHRPKTTSTPTRCNPSKAQASSGTASPYTRWNATYFT